MKPTKSDSMIRTVSDLLSEILQRELPRLDAMNVKHAPTIGDMYEGLSADLLNLAIPKELGLSVVTGFASDGQGNMSGQLDCMIVRGDGKRIPYTDSYIWHVRDIIAVIEIKKRLHSAELRDAFAQLRTVQSVERNYFDSQEDPDRPYDIASTMKAFAQTTGKVAPGYDELAILPYREQIIFRTLLLEQMSIVRIILGLHGFKSEQAFRSALIEYLEDNMGNEGFGVPSFPQLIISGNYSLVKANGHPYSTRLNGEWWPFCFSTPTNPLLLLLEFVWTRLDEVYGIGPDAWGDDLDVEVARGLLSARAVQGKERDGWELQVYEATSEKLDNTPTWESWSPAFVTLEEFVVLTRLNQGQEVRLDDPLLLAWLEEHGVAAETLRDRLLETRLVAASGPKLQLITRECQLVILPTGEYVAAENNTGRLTRWIHRHIAAAKEIGPSAGSESG